MTTDLTPAERATVDRFDAAVPAPESLRERVAEACCNADAESSGYRWDDLSNLPGFGLGIRKAYRRIADAAIAVITDARTPRPLYVNHDRTEPVAGDVAAMAVPDGLPRAFVYVRDRWLDTRTAAPYPPSDGRGIYRLLVDGETGQVVP